MRLTGKFPRCVVAAAVFALLAAVAKPVKAGGVGADTIALFPKETGEFAYADLKKARTMKWFPALQEQMLPERFRQFEKFLASAGVDPNTQVDELVWGLVADGVMKKQGATLVDPAKIDSITKIGENELTVLLYELKADLNAYLARIGPGAAVHTLGDVIEFNDRHREKEMPYFGQDMFLKAQAKGPLTEKEYLNALEKSRQLAAKEGIDAVIDQLKLDAFVAPTAGPAWITDLVNGDNSVGGSSTAAAVAGYPHITLPAGFIFGLPVGISFFGRAWSEPTLIKIAYAFEQATKTRRPPRFLPTTDLKT